MIRILTAKTDDRIILEGCRSGWKDGTEGCVNLKALKIGCVRSGPVCSSLGSSKGKDRLLARLLEVLRLPSPARERDAHLMRDV